MKKTVDKPIFCAIIRNVPAGVAHPVERHLAKVEVASSSLVTRSIKRRRESACVFRSNGSPFIEPKKPIIIGFHTHAVLSEFKQRFFRIK